MKQLQLKLIFLVLLFGVFGQGSVQAQQPGTYNIKSAKSAKYLNVKDGKTDNGTPIIIWPYAGGKAKEQFTLEKAGGEYFYIKTLGKYLHIQDASSKTKKVVHLWNGKGAPQTQWRFLDAGNGHFYIQSRLGHYMDVKQGNNDGGTPVWMWTKNGSDAQRWKLILNSGNLNKSPRVNLEIALSDLYVKIHNRDCARMQGEIEAFIIDKRFNTKHLPLNDGSLLKFDGNKKCDFKVREEFFYGQSGGKRDDTNAKDWYNPIVFEVDKKSLDNGELVLWLQPFVSGGHKGGGPFDFYGCKIKYNQLQSIVLNPKKKNYGIVDHTLKFPGDKHHTIMMTAIVVEQRN